MYVLSKYEISLHNLGTKVQKNLDTTKKNMRFRAETSCFLTYRASMVVLFAYCHSAAITFFVSYAEDVYAAWEGKALELWLRV